MNTRRYLSSEPLLARPEWVASELQQGHQVPAYACARNNSLHFIDPNGLFGIKGGSDAEQPAARKAIHDVRRRAKDRNDCRCELQSQSGQWEADFTEGLGPTISIEPGLAVPFTAWSGEIHLMGDVR